MDETGNCLIQEDVASFASASHHFVSPDPESQNTPTSVQPGSAIMDLTCQSMNSQTETQNMRPLNRLNPFTLPSLRAYGGLRESIASCRSSLATYVPKICQRNKNHHTAARNSNSYIQQHGGEMIFGIGYRFPRRLLFVPA